MLLCYFTVVFAAASEKTAKRNRTNVAIREKVCYNRTGRTADAAHIQKTDLRRHGAHERGMAMAKMTRMQQKIYDYIAQALREQGYPPSVREIGEAVGLKSPSTVHFHLKHMEELGVLTKGAGKGRALTLAQSMQGEMPDGAPVQEEAAPAADRIPVVGSVAAGSPILAEECIEDYLTFDTGGREGEYFALRVRGESMLNAGILPDDLVVVHRQPTAHNGEIVVALLGDEATVKRLSRRNGEVWLLPENENYRPIDGREATLLGKVTAVVREYN